MPIDLATPLMAATVEVEQPLPDGRHMIGTGFLVSDPTPDGRPRTILVTANHVLDKMPGETANLGYRVQDKDGGWRYAPQPLTIRAGGHALWTRNPDRDVAAIVVDAPPAFARAAIPLAWLADGDTFSRAAFGPGQEMLVLGYPQGLSANSAGFPILRAGRVASPVEAATASPTFLLDFRVFPGNSGGPVFMLADPAQATPVVVGLLTQQVEMNNERLEIGIVTEAPFVRETLALLDRPASGKPKPVAPTTVAQGAATAASS
ncbi:MAG: serine protease, partial [Caulobacteraceae bacterium]|nr:serine protease [Caulobacteraceae bacterium]